MNNRMFFLNLVSIIFICLGIITLSAQDDTDPTQTSDDLIQSQNSYNTQPDSADGITFETAYTSDVFSNVNGGLRQQTEYLHNIDINLALNLESLIGWKGASLFFYGLENYGGSPTENVGDAQGVSNIDAYDTWKLYEAWFEQNLFNDKFSLRTGLYDLNSEFYVTETAGLFVNSSFGIGAEYAQTGLNGPSIFPTTSFGLRIKFSPTDAFYVQSVVLDGIPGAHDNPRGTHIHFHKNDGLLISAEAGRIAEESDNGYSKYALGVWSYTTQFDAVYETNNLGEPMKYKANYGFYGIAEKSVYQETYDPSQGLAMFLDLGLANGKINQFNLYAGGGMVYTGFFSQRPEDQIGFAFAAVFNGNEFRKAQLAAGTPVDKTEVTLELTYRSQVLPWLAVQPDFQYIINPGTDPGIANALVFGTRAEVAF